ncbi:3-dehydroquinate synthase [Rubricella aquisinus]|uniref:3-dehydroquinate synthase n=1 Tax=Rubricella aquisinus TaxID=2028108 RepID=A0A840X661_9RHOB|nr:3-dehydroquinate synthase [Rubricella aquisinus]MBB5516197.1 3-dehydroquinate synthase [Rubricella aquisinus]
MTPIPPERLTVSLGSRSYDILIGRDVIRDTGRILKDMGARARVAIVTERRVADLRLGGLLRVLEEAGFTVSALVLEPGEGTKDWKNLTRTVDWLLSQKIERDDLVIALGGGVIGDLAGFAAAILRRGVGVVQIPTTLLSQVDSSVGGKTGINSHFGKNLIGAFHQPRLVLADTALLDSLTDRDFRAGYGEVVKYGLLGDAGFFAWLEQNGPALLAREPAALAYAVRRSCEMKAEIVARDEEERGDRALLNLGHTFCHALEAATGYSDRLLHGEGVAIGCLLAFDVSARSGLCAQEEPSRIAAHFAQMGLKTRLADIPGDLPDAEGLMRLMAQDKKVQDGRITFILAHGIGEAFVSRNADLETVKAVLSEALEARA